MTRRESFGAAIIFAWLVGLALLARRELFVAEPQQLREAALNVVPGTVYYEVLNGEEHVGWASASIDTSATGISVRDVIVLDVRDSTRTKRVAARARASLTPGLRLTDFSFELGGDHGPYSVSGKLREDTLLQLISSSGKARPDTSYVTVRQNVFWPSTVPLALALAARPKVGRTYKYSIYDPTSGTPQDIQLAVGAESLFVIADSARMDDASGKWVAAHSDTVRGWRLDSQSATPVTGWIDERGRAIETTPTGTFTLRRTAYELAFRNWALGAEHGAENTKHVHHTTTTR